MGDALGFAKFLTLYYGLDYKIMPFYDSRTYSLNLAFADCYGEVGG